MKNTHVNSLYLHCITSIAAALMLLVCTSVSLADSPDQPRPDQHQIDKSTRPFLITGKLPHLTGMLIKKWDDPKLGLTDQQKRWLKVVREETISDVRRISSDVSRLEKLVVDGINTGLEPDDLYDTVKEIARLKTEATMIHLKCIYDTRKILKPQQMQYLLGPGLAEK